MKTLLTRMIGAATFDAKTYEAVEADRSCNTSAILIVIIPVSPARGAQAYETSPAL